MLASFLILPRPQTLLHRHPLCFCSVSACAHHKLTKTAIEGEIDVRGWISVLLLCGLSGSLTPDEELVL